MAEGKTQAVVVGAGLGGLMTAAFLARRGHQVTILEAQGIPGGRFTHIDYEGFAVPTGAFHALPAGVRGHLFRALCRIGVSVPLVEPAPSVQVCVEERFYPLHLDMTRSQSSELRRLVGVHRRGAVLRSVARMLLEGALGRDFSAAEGMRRIGGTEVGLRLLDHLTKFSLSVPADQASAVDLLRSLRSQRYGRDAFLYYGSADLVARILAVAQEAGAKLHLRTPVARVLFRTNRAVGVETASGDRVDADLVILNTPGSKALSLIGEMSPESLRARVQRLKPTHGFTHCVRSRQRLRDHASIEIPLDRDHIAGLVPLSNICPLLAPDGWHFILAYQWRDPNRDLEEQLDRGREELVAHLGPKAEIFNSASYYGSNPTANIAQCIGQHGRHRLPAQIPGIPNLYLVGHDVEGYGTAAELIGYSCNALWDRWSR